MKLKQPTFFLLLTIAWSWTFWLLGLNHLSDGLNAETFAKFLPLFFAGVYGPSASAIITTFIFEGHQGLVLLLKKFIVFKAPMKVYLTIILLPLLSVGIGLIIYNTWFGDIGDFSWKAYLSIPTTLWAGFYAGPLGEELGWRGFLLPKLQKQFSEVKSAILIGLIWFVWHIPLFWAPFGTLVSGDPISYLPVLTYLIMIIAISCIITWLVNQSKGSVWIALLFHLSLNAGLALLFFPDMAAQYKTIHFLSSVPMVIVAMYLVHKTKLRGPVLDKVQINS